MKRFRIGRHINTSHGFTTAPAYADSIDCEVLQVFLGNPQAINSKPKQEKDLIKFSSELNKYKLKMVVHSSYTINLCHPPKSKQFQASVRSLVRDLNATHIIGKRCMGVVIHMGKNIKANNITNQQAIRNYIRGLKKALSETPDDTIIILETGASQGTEVGSKIDGLEEIYWALDAKQRRRVKFCIDTCHIWATGYDISTRVGVRKFFNEFNRAIGIDRIACIHFNDSKTGLDSNVDRHADLGHGHIKSVGLKAVLKFAQKHKISVIMETPLDTVNPKTNKDVTFPQELAKIKKWLRE